MIRESEAILLVRQHLADTPKYDHSRAVAEARLKEVFSLASPPGRRVGGEGDGKVAYRDVAGLCKAATLKEIEADVLLACAAR